MSNKKKIVVLTGAGISAESGIRTFRDSNGLWENHDVMEVASPQGWHKNRELVLRFYNDRRKQLAEVEPNIAHKGLVDLEKYFDVVIITQNVDNLHERAGSSNVLHLHGELTKVRSTADESLVYDWEYKPINIGDTCEKGSQLRPHIVWFGEMVPMIEVAAVESSKADIFMIVGTSLNVYPASGLIDYVKDTAPKYIIDPSMPNVLPRPNLHLIEEKGSTGVAKVAKEIIEKYATK